MGKVKSSLKKVFPAPIVSGYRIAWRLFNDQKTVINNQLRQLKYAGDAVACPFCEQSFSKFRLTGALDRLFWCSKEGRKLLESPEINVANAKCPKCGSGERQRLLYFYLLKKLDFFNIKGTRVLDVAPDDFLLDKVFSKADIDYISIDIRNSRNPSRIMDVTNLEFENNMFDSIICNHVLEHIPQDMIAMGELYRVLKPGGWAILQVPIWAFETVEIPKATRDQYLQLYGHSDHVRRYGFDYQKRLEKSGFVVIADQFSRKLEPEFRERYGLFETEDIYYCTKD